MAGSDPRFNPVQFRDAITFAMNMGLPTDDSESATFHFRKTKQFPTGTRLDQDGNPLDPNVLPVVERPEPVKVPCAVEFSPAGLDERPVGAFKPTKAVITILDVHWPQVQDAIEVELGGDRYVISYTEPPIGLFEVTVYRMVCFARQET